MREWTRLGDVVHILTGYPFKSAQFTQKPEDVPLLRGDNVIQRRIRWDGAQRWPASDAESFTQYRLELGDVVLAMDRPWIEAGLKVADVREGSAGALLVQRVARLRAKEKVDQGYLKWLLYEQRFTDHILGVQTGTAIPHISKTQIESYRVSLPPLDEQRRIAGVLGALDDLIDTNRRLVAAAFELAGAAFDQLVSREQLRLRRLSDITEKIGSGATPRGGKEVYQKHGVGFIRSQNVYDGQFSFDGLAKISVAAADALAGVTVQPGDVLVNITGESVTRTVLVPERALPARVSQHVAIVRPRQDLVDPRFLMLALLSRPVKAYLDTLSTAGATRRALTKAHLGQTEIPVPSLADQVRVSQPFDVVAQLSEEIAGLERVRDELLPSLMSGQVRVSFGRAAA
ncbi:restriction endonuclease subunit S [Dactylosporangium sp. NPDC050588]|uniref:restriction endonuclease subunit S n=1 Tax=Dactylosporangium sp. NPDC050588 TaxID=3157211 RepID=UPI0033F27E28